MKYVLFTKMFKEQSIEQLIKTAKSVGADGLDIAVRPGYPINATNVRRALPAAVKQIEAAGLSIPLVSTPVDWVDPADPFAENLWAACHDCGIANIKIGYWNFKGGDYYEKLDLARKALDKFSVFGSRFGIRTLIHNHSGNYININASAVMTMIRDRNPFEIGAYLDPGHLNVNGEPITMALDIVGKHLAMVAVKDSLIVRVGNNKPRRTDWVPFGTGTVNWAELMKGLHDRGYASAISFHSEYETLKPDALIAQTAADIRYLRALG